MPSLRYGENPHQKASWELDSRIEWRLHQGKGLSYTNLLDLNSAVRIVLEFDEYASAIVKHTNPCGVATGALPIEAYIRAREADRLSSYGGIVAVNNILNPDLAAEICSTYIECVIAPYIQQSALEVFRSKTDLRVVEVDFKILRQLLVSEQDVKRLLIGTLSQVRDFVREASKPWPYEVVGQEFPKVVTKRRPTAKEWEALRFAWRVCAGVKSNAVIFTNEFRTLAIGAGQSSRIDSVNVARMKAKNLEITLALSVSASDAFFPFRDGLDAVASAGATAVVQPGGSKNDAEVIAAADEHGLAMVFTGRRHFRH